MLGVGVAVEFARREEEESADGLPAIEVEQRAKSPDIGIECLDGILAIEHRRCHRCQMDDIVGLTGILHSGDIVADDVEFLDVHLRALLQFLHPFGIAEHEVVESDDFPDAQFIGLLVEEVHEVIAEETGTPCDENGGVFQSGTFIVRQFTKRVVDVVG